MDENFEAHRAWETIERLTREVDALQLAVNAAHVRIKEYEIEKETIEDRIASQKLDLLVQSDRARELRSQIAGTYRRGFADADGDGEAARGAARLHLLDRMTNAGNAGDAGEMAEALAWAERWLASDPGDTAIREVRDRLRGLALRGA